MKTMKIEQVAYLDFLSEDMADALVSKFGIKKCEYSYSNCPVGPASLMLGSNSHHYYAERISDRPIVVFDQHTDMYIKKSEIPMGVSNTNWLYWRIKRGCEAHLVMPRVHEIHYFGGHTDCGFNLPAGNKDKLHVYFVEKSDKSPPGWLDCGESVLLKESDVKSLERLKATKKQVSFDFDFLRDVGVEEAANILKATVGKEDICDFWLDLPRDFDESLHDCMVLFEAVNSAD